MNRRLAGTIRIRRLPARPTAVALLALPLLLAACGGPSSASTPTPPGVTATAEAPLPTSASLPPPDVGAIAWASAIDPGTRAPVSRVEQFPADAPVIYAVVPVRNLPAGVGLSAAWSYNDNRLGIATTPVTTASGVASGYVEFHLARDDGQPWPEGTYGITISLEGRVEATATVDVVNP